MITQNNRFKSFKNNIIRT